jgi:hypothetical protein
MGFKFFPVDYQWIFGLLTPFIESFFIWILVKISYKASDCKGLKIARISCTHYMKTRHALFLAVLVGSNATTATTYCIIGICFFVNLISSLKIIYLIKKKGLPKDSKIGKQQSFSYHHFLGLAQMCTQLQRPCIYQMKADIKCNLLII